MLRESTEIRNLRLLNVREAAHFLRLSETTVWRMARAGRLPAYRIGVHWRFDREELVAWIKGQGNGHSHTKDA